MTSRTKNTTKSVSFNTMESDRILLDAIAERLESKEFKNFSDLCKTALEQYFLPSELPIAPLQNQIAQFEETLVSQHFHQIEAQLTALMEQTQSLTEKGISTDSRDESAIELFESQLKDLRDRVQKLEKKSAIDLEFQLKKLEERIQQLEQQSNLSPISQNPISQHPNSDTTDPLLNRLTPFLEEF